MKLEELCLNPFDQFEAWFEAARTSSGLRYPDACCLSTLSESGYPEGRMVLMKDFDEKGFTFYSNSFSNKGKALAKLAKASLTFYWDILERQVRIQGDVSFVSDAEADLYFASRPREAQLGAWASRQSEALEKREVLESRVREFDDKFSAQDVPRPPHWRGFLLRPLRIEFWQERPARLHDRFLYSRLRDDNWEISRLYP